MNFDYDSDYMLKCDFDKWQPKRHLNTPTYFNKSSQQLSRSISER